MRVGGEDGWGGEEWWEVNADYYTRTIKSLKKRKEKKIMWLDYGPQHQAYLTVKTSSRPANL